MNLFNLQPGGTFTGFVTRLLSRRKLAYQRPRGHSRGPLGTARGGQEQQHVRAGEALGPFDVARSSKRTDEQERCIHGDETEGGSQGSRAAPSGEVLSRAIDKAQPGLQTQRGAPVHLVLADYAQSSGVFP